jgi:hypothetical protein
MDSIHLFVSFTLGEYICLYIEWERREVAEEPEEILRVEVEGKGTEACR